MINNDLQNIINKLIGLKARNVKLGHGSFITIDFGKDIETQIETNKGIRKRIRGEWHLWIYECCWRFDKNNNPLCGSENDRKKIEELLKIVENKELLKVDILTNSFDAKLYFEEDIYFYLFSNNTEDAEQWMLFTPDNKVFVAGPNINCSYKNSNE